MFYHLLKDSQNSEECYTYCDLVKTDFSLVMYTGMFQWCTHACSSDVHRRGSRRGFFLFGFSCCNKDTMTKSNLCEERVYLAYPSGQSSSLREAKVGTQARQKTGGRSWSRDQGGTLLNCSLFISCSIGPLAQGWSHLQWAGPSYINHIQENAPQACL